MGYKFSTHSPLVMDPLRAYDRKTGRDQVPCAFPGSETTMGHAYSVMLETAARNGIELIPNLEEFLNHVHAEVTRVDYCPRRNFTTSSRMYYGRESNGVFDYMVQNEVPPQVRETIMLSLLPPFQKHEFAPYLANRQDD